MVRSVCADKFLSRRIGLSAISVPATNFAIMAIGILTSVLVARMLGAEGRGLFLTWQAWATVVANIANLAIAQTIVTTTLYASLPPRRQFLTIAALVALLCALLSMAVMPLVTSGVVSVATAILFALANSLGGIYPAVFQRLKKMDVAYNVVRILPPLAYLASVAYLLLTGRGDLEQALITVSLVSLTVTVAIGVVVVRRYSTRGEVVKGFFRQSSTLAPPIWALYFYETAALLAVSVFYDAAAVAFFGVATSVQAAVVSLGRSVSARWFSVKERGSRELPLAVVLEVLAVAGLPAAGVLVLGHWAIPFAFGTEFDPAVQISYILAICGVVRSVDLLLWHHALDYVGPGQLLKSRVVAIGFAVTAIGVTSRMQSDWSLEAAGVGVTMSVAIGTVMLFAIVRRSPA